MSLITLEPALHAEVAASLPRDGWIVACLCARWCNVCEGFRAAFARFADRHPDLPFLWIDVEDNAAVAGDIDIENFPTLLVQYGATVAFLGTTLPDDRVMERILLAQREKTPEQLAREAVATPEHRAWQEQAELHRRLAEAAITE